MDIWQFRVGPIITLRLVKIDLILNPKRQSTLVVIFNALDVKDMGMSRRCALQNEIFKVESEGGVKS
jgi:hypothetical protein